MARMASMDIAKGIAIACVVVSHSGNLGVPSNVVDALFTFHMPLFFIISGFFTKPDVELNRAYVEKNVRALIYPYLVTSVLVLALMFVRTVLFEPSRLLLNMVTTTAAALYGAGADAGNLPAGVTAIGAIWFLLAMFWGKLLLAAANKAPYTPVVVLSLFALGYVSRDFWLPWSVQAGMCAVLFLYIGQLMRKADLLAPSKLHPLLWVVVCAGWVYFMCTATGVRMVANEYPDGVVVDVLAGVLGTLCVIKLSEQLELRLASVGHALEKLGAVSLAVFCMHLVELDVFPWGPVLEMFAFLPVPTLVWGLLLRCCVIAALMGFVYVLPRPVSGVFYSSRKRLKAGA